MNYNTISIVLTSTALLSCSKNKINFPPTIVFILDDNKGWGDLNINGDTNIEMTVIDRWSQNRQAEGHVIAVKSSKEKILACGDFLIWMALDCFPCMVNTAIIDFEGNPKPVAEQLSKIWKNNDQIIYSQKKNEND